MPTQKPQLNHNALSAALTVGRQAALYGALTFKEKERRANDHIFDLIQEFDSPEEYAEYVCATVGFDNDQRGDLMDLHRKFYIPNSDPLDCVEL